MTKQVRDWNKDMELCEKATQNKLFWYRMSNDQPQMSIYWLQQYANESEKKDQYWAWYQDEEKRANDAVLLVEAEKERGDKLQAELSEYTEEHWKQFEREKKLREAIEAAITQLNHAHDYEMDSRLAERKLREVLASLYPKEEEANE